MSKLSANGKYCKLYAREIIKQSVSYNFLNTDFSVSVAY